MAARKSERLLNLLITLLVSRSYVTKERIRSVVEQYRDAGDEAFEKMFERDKEEPRSLGIPVEVGYVDRAFEDEPGYRVERAGFELPQIDLEADEPRSSARRPGLAARRPRLGHLRRPGQAQGGRGQRGPRRPQRGAAPARRRGAHLRGVLGGHPVPHAGGLRLPDGGAASAATATSSRGAWSPTTAAGTSSGRTPTAGPCGCSGSPGSAARCATTGGPARSRSPRAPTSAP